MVELTWVSVALSTVPVIPGLSDTMAEAVESSLPAKSTVKEVPCTPVKGKIDEMTGSGKFWVVKLDTNSLLNPLLARSRMPLARM